MARPDCPKTFPQFVLRFPTDEHCRLYLVESRWPDGDVTCPECGLAGWYTASREIYSCAKGHQWSATSGTIMHRTKVPLTMWFWGAYLVTTDKRGMSAKGFARQLGISRYETAYMLLQKLRAAMVNPERGKIGGAGKTIEMDEAFITGGRKAEGHKGVLQPLLAAVEVQGDKAGRLRMAISPNKNTKEILAFLRHAVEIETTVITDGNPAYERITHFGYHHAVEEEDVDYRLPVIHRVFSNFKTWLLGTHHGAVMHKHLQAYVNEFVFRFNRRNTPQAAFQTVLGLGSHLKGPTYEGIYEGTWTHPNPRRGA
jgi:transposase-like protein